MISLDNVLKCAIVLIYPGSFTRNVQKNKHMYDFFYTKTEDNSKHQFKTAFSQSENIINLEPSIAHNSFTFTQADLCIPRR